MKNIFYMMLLAAAICSCSKSYTIEGTSNIAQLDGRMMFLKTIEDGKVKNIDSCEVVHGKFSFDGKTDSVKMATIYMDEESVMPVVLEEGKISIQLDNTKQHCGGTELNDKLFAFIEKYNKLQSQYSDLAHRENQGIMDGEDMEVVYKHITAEAERITVEEDKLITSFICENFDNVLGPGVFMMVTSAYEYPMLSPWIDDIMSKATDTFKNHTYVKDFMDAAQKNQNIMNGMDAPVPQPQTPLTQTPVQDAAPTPAEMAKPLNE